jgi:hypothetical protein
MISAVGRSSIVVSFTVESIKEVYTISKTGQRLKRDARSQEAQHQHEGERDDDGETEAPPQPEIATRHEAVFGEALLGGDDAGEAEDFQAEAGLAGELERQQDGQQQRPNARRRESRG